MYTSFEDFQRDAVACGKAYYSDASFQPQALELAFKIYSNACRGTTLLDADGKSIGFGITVVGRLALKSRAVDGREEFEWIPSDESFPSIDTIMKENLGTLSEVPSDQVGSILDSKKWSLLANDAWLIGSIHAGTEFHFASPLINNNLWDNNKNRLTVSGREAIGIVSHGYEIRLPNPKLEAVAVCTDPAKARAATLLTYKSQVELADRNRIFHCWPFDGRPSAKRS
jgi:hypothetical protein